MQHFRDHLATLTEQFIASRPPELRRAHAAKRLDTARQDITQYKLSIEALQLQAVATQKQLDSAQTQLNLLEAEQRDLESSFYTPNPTALRSPPRCKMRTPWPHISFNKHSSALSRLWPYEALLAPPYPN